MSWDFLRFHEFGPATWFYLSLLLAVAVYVRFGRLWSLRNWDLLTLFLLIPGVLAATQVDQIALDSMVQQESRVVTGENGSQVPPAVANDPSWLALRRFAYLWLFAATGYFVFRALLDLALVRRPRLEQNLTSGGLLFLSVCLFGYLVISVVANRPETSERSGARAANRLLSGATDSDPGQGTDPVTLGFSVLPAATQRGLAAANPQTKPTDAIDVEDGIVRSTVILCHLVLLSGLLLVGAIHFQSLSTGIAMVLLYLLFPVTFLHAFKLDHLIPATLLVWAVYFYRSPCVAGAIFGLASVSFFPLLLLPAWISFYRTRGWKSFLAWFLAVTAVLWAIVYFVPMLQSFREIWLESLQWNVLILTGTASRYIGFWTETTEFYRLPVALIIALVVAGSYFVPRRKSLGDLIAISALIILLVQFLYLDHGGTYVHWYLPMLLMLFFRPNLADVYATKSEPVPRPG